MTSLKINHKSSTVLKNKLSKIAGNIFRFYMLIVIGFVVLYPIIYMISNSIKSNKALLDVRYLWIPRFISSAGLEDAMKFLDFGPSLTKTLTIQIISALIEVFVCSVIAYGFARFNFKFKSVAMVFLIISLVIPLPMYSMSLSVIFRNLGLFDTNFVYYLPSLLGVGIKSGMLIYIYIQFFKGLPRELEDAAYVDGAGPIRTFLQIALPSSSVVIVTVSVLSIVWHWNETYLAQVCLSDEVRPLAVMLNLFTSILNRNGYYLNDDPYATTLALSACILFMIIPLIIYLILQRKFVKSIDRVGITG